MPDVYDRLAEKFDHMPQGFPSTDSGIELQILRRIFSPEDAEMALNLGPMPETAKAIAERLGKPEEEMRDILDKMAKKGQIHSVTMSGEQVYCFVAFMPGVWEFQVLRADVDNAEDKELLQLCHEYFPSMIKKVGGYEPGLARTVPINVQVEAESQVQPYENVGKIIGQAKSALLLDCQCRKELKMLGKGCDHTIENCLWFSMDENAFDYFRIGGRVISIEEAKAVLEKTEEEGLVHNTFYNVKEGHIAICNCCSCSCALLRGVKKLGAANAFAKSNFVALIDQDTCSECGVCADERCPMDAIAEEGAGYRVQPDACIGCGACTVTCPTESITLVQRPESEHNQPADNIFDWFEKRAASRGMGA
jgi:NAD-dependent dihydropyrimidine dehydrogenase PreA subunit